MGISDWINLIAAIIVGGGTLFLGITAWKSIRQTRDIQKDEQKIRVIDEIIEWATDVASFCTAFNLIPIALTTSELDLGTRKSFQIMKWRSDARTLLVRSQHILPMSFTFGIKNQLRKKLTDAIEKTISALSSYCAILENEREVKSKHSNKLNIQLNEVFRCAMSVLEEADTIKYIYLKV